MGSLVDGTLEQLECTIRLSETQVHLGQLITRGVTKLAVVEPSEQCGSRAVITAQGFNPCEGGNIDRAAVGEIHAVLDRAECAVEITQFLTNPGLPEVSQLKRRVEAHGL